MAERAFISRGTLYKVERGDPTVSMGIYATVLSILGLIDGLGQAADRREDTLGLDIDEDRLPKENCDFSTEGWAVMTDTLEIYTRPRRRDPIGGSLSLCGEAKKPEFGIFLFARMVGHPEHLRSRPTKLAVARRPHLYLTPKSQHCRERSETRRQTDGDSS